MFTDVINCPKSKNELGTHRYLDIDPIPGFKRPMKCKWCKNLKDGTSSSKYDISQSYRVRKERLANKRVRLGIES